MPLPYPPFKTCPCGSGRSYAACCQPAHSGHTPAQTPEALMRSRYAAFFLQDADYVLATWHPDTRPADLNLQDGTRYTGLKIHASSVEGNTGEVDFTVNLKAPDGRATRFRERSRFVREGGQADGRWLYVDGDFV